MNEYRYNEEDHIHEILDGGVYKPLVGTSTMSNVLAKPLTWWASGLAVEKFGWVNKGNAKTGWIKKEDRLAVSIPRRAEISTFTDEEYLSLLDDAYAAHSKKLTSSAKDGVDMHELMERYIKLCISKYEGKPVIVKTENEKLKIFMDWAISKVKKFLWSEAHCYSREHWLGGISDCGFEDIEGKYAILDFKSSKEVYLSQFWQCIGYAMQLEENGAFTKEGDNLFKLDKPIEYVAVLPFRMDNPEVQYNFDMIGGKDAVRAMLLLHNKLK